jgi:hypothetical protein
MTKDEDWAKRAVRALLRKLMEQLAREHESAAAELRRAAK